MLEIITETFEPFLGPGSPPGNSFNINYQQNTSMLIEIQPTSLLSQAFAHPNIVNPVGHQSFTYELLISLSPCLLNAINVGFGLLVAQLMFLLLDKKGCTNQLT
jgi:hypothetical protein